MKSLAHLCFSLLVLGGLLTACAAPPTAALLPTAVPTFTLTSVPPTGTPSPRPASTATPSGPPTPTTQPAIDARSIEDVAGTWLVHYRAGVGMGTVDIKLQLDLDGTYHMETVKNQDPWGDGTFHFQDGKLHFENQRCMNPRGDILPCTGIYTVRSVYRGDAPVLLRFKLVEDKLDRERALSLDNVLLGLAEP